MERTYLKMAPVLSKNHKVGLVLALTTNLDKKKTKRKVWTKQWLLKRKQLSHVNIVRELDSDDFRNFMRMDHEAFQEILNLVKPYITKQDTIMREAVTAEERLIVTLKYLASGRDYKELRFSSAISTQLMSEIIPQTCNAICKVLKKYIQIPETEEAWLEVAKHFETMWNFNHCVGSMDGKHIQIIKPPDSGSLFYNYKGTFSVVLFAVVNANYEFLYFHTGMNGSVSDSGVLQNTKFYEKLINGELNIPKESILPGTESLAPYVFIGDSAFAINKHIIKPYPQKGLTKETKIFNYRLSRARRVVENTFGILAARFRIFQKPILLNLKNVDIVVKASCYLHNFLRQKSKNYISHHCIDHEDVDNNTVQAGQWRDYPQLLSLQGNSQRLQTEEGKRVRNIFTTFFNGPGAVDFQERMVNVLRID